MLKHLFKILFSKEDVPNPVPWWKRWAYNIVYDDLAADIAMIKDGEPLEQFELKDAKEKEIN